MKFKTTYVLLAVVAVLLVFVYFFEIRGKAGKDKAKESATKLVDLASEDIEKVSFRKPDGTIVLKKDEKGEWLIIEPFETKADKYEAEGLADNFARLSFDRVVEEEPQDLAAYEIPKEEVTLWVKGREQPLKILVGMENPLDKSFFAKREDEKRVVLLPSHLKSTLEKKLFDFREKEVFQFKTEDVKSLRVEAKDIQWEASLEDKEWFLQNPVKALADKSKVENILTSLSGLKAKEFASEQKNAEDIKKYGLEIPAYEVALDLPLAGQKLIFSIHKTEDKTYAATNLSQKIISIEDAILADLDKKPEELRLKKVADFYAWETKKVEIRRGDLHLTAAKDKDEKWRFDSGGDEEADGSKVDGFIRKIEGLEAVEFIDSPGDLSAYGLVNPQAEVRFWVKEDEDKTKEIRILFGIEDKEKKQIVAKNERLEYLFRVDSGFLEEFPKSSQDWRPKPEEKK